MFAIIKNTEIIKITDTTYNNPVEYVIIPILDTRSQRLAQDHTADKENWGTSLVVQWLRLLASKVRGWGWVPGQGTRCPMLQLRPSTDK